LILALATAPPSDSPTVQPGLDPTQVGPGFAGFLVTFGVVAVMFFVIRDMVKRIRRVRYRGQVEEAAAAEREALRQQEADGAVPGEGGKREQPRVGGSHGPDADYLDSGSRDDGRTGSA